MNKKYSLIRYDSDSVESLSSDALDEVLSRISSEKITWLIVRGYDQSDKKDFERLLSSFSADPAYSDKILNQVPLEFSDSLPTCLYFEYSIPTPYFDPETKNYLQNHGSIVLGERYLIVFDENSRGLLNDIQRKVQEGQTRAQAFGADYLLYLVFRVAFNLLNQLVNVELINRFDKLEDAVISDQSSNSVLDELLTVREYVKPINQSLRRIKAFLVLIRDDEIRFVTKKTQRLFTRNLENDLDELEASYLLLRNWLRELLDIYRTNVSQRTNRIIYILTILSAIFLPITFVSSVYSMRFEYMPWIHRPFGMYGVLFIMVAIVLGMVIYMRKKGWI